MSINSVKYPYPFDILLRHTKICQMKVRVIPITKHLMNRVHQHGEVWDVITRDDVTGRVLARSEEMTFKGAHGEMEHDLRWLNRGEFEVLD